MAEKVIPQLGGAEMKSLRARAMLKSSGYTKRSGGRYTKTQECPWCGGFGSTDCWVCSGSGKSTTGDTTLDKFKKSVSHHGYHTQIHPCEKCGELITASEYCCDGYLCGCGGMPIHAPYCSKCLEERLG